MRRGEATVNAGRAAVYVRVSDPKQERHGTSLATQEAACRNYCEERGWTVVATYADVHTGADLYERPSLSDLRAAVRRREVDVVVAHALDRLSRDQDHRGLLFSEADRAGVGIELVTEKLEDTPEGRLLLAVRSFTAEIERLKIMERSQRGVRARAAAGKLLPGPRPLYGYRWRDEDKSALDIDPATGPVVRRVVGDVLAGRSLRSIAAALEAEGVPTPNGGRRWAISVLSQMLKHPAYRGDATALRWRSERVRGGRSRQSPRPVTEHVQLPAGTIPPLMTAAEFAAIGARLERNRLRAVRNNGRPAAALLRGGIARCGVCGCALTVENRTTRAGEPWARYRCSNHDGAPTPTMAAASLDAAVWRIVEGVVADPSVIAAKVAQLGQHDPSADELAAVERRLATTEEQRRRLARRVAALEVDDAAMPLLDELKEQAAQARRLQEKRTALSAESGARQATREQVASLGEWCRRVAANLPTLGYEERRQLLDGMGATVRLWDAAHEPRWELVMRPNPADGGGIVYESAIR